MKRLATRILTALLTAVFSMNVYAQTPSSQNTSFAYLGGGCFWCLEAGYEIMPGVKDVVSGYAGGATEKPSYEAVCSGKTGHAEIVRIEYDPSRITYEKLLEFFWRIHDPTTLNRQGADVGTQYRSIILYTDETQHAAATAAIAEYGKKLADPIVTQVVPLTKFYEAEAYHQDFFAKNPEHGYCKYVIRPKLAKARSH